MSKVTITMNYSTRFEGEEFVKDHSYDVDENVAGALGDACEIEKRSKNEEKKTAEKAVKQAPEDKMVKSENVENK